MSVAEVFFDTNVPLYLLSGDLAKASRAEALLAAGGAVSVQVLNEFASVALGKLKMTFGDVREVLHAIRASCIVLPLDVATHELALDLADRYKFQIYDGLIVAAALQANCSVLYTEDLQDGQTIDRLTIRNPFA